MQFILIMGPNAPQSNVFNILGTLTHEFRHHYQITRSLSMTRSEMEVDAYNTTVNSWVWEGTSENYRSDAKSGYNTNRTIMKEESNPNYNKYLSWEQLINNRKRNKK